MVVQGRVQGVKRPDVAIGTFNFLSEITLCIPKQE